MTRSASYLLGIFALVVLLADVGLCQGNCGKNGDQCDIYNPTCCDGLKCNVACGTWACRYFCEAPPSVSSSADCLPLDADCMSSNLACCTGTSCTRNGRKFSCKPTLAPPPVGCSPLLSACDTQSDCCDGLNCTYDPDTGASYCEAN